MAFGNTIVAAVLGGPSTPVDSNAGANSVAEGAAVNTSVGVTAHSTSQAGTVTYSLSSDSSAGGFKIDPVTGVVTVADPSKIDFETAPGHAYTITTSASDGITTSSQSFTIAVTDVAPSTPVDTNAAANTVVEGAANGTAVGVSASSIDINGPAVTYSLTSDTSGGGFTINATTGVVTVADATKIDYESSGPGHSYTVIATASDGTLSSSQSITIAVTDVPLPTPVDSNAAANSVAEGAANGSTVGLTALAVDPNGPATTYSLTGNAGGRFAIDPTTGVVTVANGAAIDFETAPGHAYTVTVQANDGVQTTSQNFSIAVTDVAPSTPVDVNGAANTVAEGAIGPVGITVSSTDPGGGPAVTYSLSGDTSGGGFSIDSVTGVISIANSSKIDYETAAGHAYTVTAQASDGTLTSSQTFTIAVTDVAPSTPTDSNAAGNGVFEGAANGTAVGITASSTDINGPAVTYSLIGDTTSGGYTINATTGVVTVADGTKIDYESAPLHSDIINVQASDGTLTSTQFFTIAVGNVAPSQPVDNDTTANAVAEGAAVNTTVGVTASSSDISGGAVTYFIGIDSSGGGFKVDPTTGVISVADPSKINYETAPGHAYTVSIGATDGTSPSTGQVFTIAVTDVAPSTPVDSDGTSNTVFEGAANGTAVGLTASSTDVNGPAVSYSLTADSSGGGFFIDPSTGVVRVANGALIDYETAPGHAYGITVQATAGALSSTQNFSIGVGNVNEAPAGTDKAVLIAEDTPYTFGVADFGFSDPSDSSAPNSLLAVKMTTVPGAGAGTLTNNGNPVNAGDTVLATDIAANHLVFTPALNANGSPEATFTFQVQDNGGTANGGVDLDQSPNTFTFNVSAVNDAPVNSVPGTQSVNEDATLTFSSGTGNAITISDVDVGSGDETVTLTVGSGTLALGSTASLTSFTNNAASITLTGTVAHVNTALNGLTYHGNLNFNGADSLAVSTSDNGNTGSGGPQNDTDSITINVAPVNDAPVNSVPGAQTVNEDTNLVFTGANAISISDVDGGSGDETVTLTVASGALALGSTAGLTSFTNNAASITLTGTIAHINTALDGLTYKGNLNFNGADSLQIVTHDNGNTGGGDLTDTDSVTINVTAVNDAPSFTVGGTQNVLEDSGAHTVNGFATGISPGPANEAGQTVNFLTGNDNNALFTAQPTIDASGNLTYTLAANANGSATVTVQLHDNGGTANGGIDTSGSQAFTINASPVNDAPAGTNNSFTILEDSSHTFTAAEFGFSDPVDAANASGANAFQAVVITTIPGAGTGTLTLDTGGGPVAVTAGQTVAVGNIGGLVFTPAANANGSPEASFTFAVQDNGGTANGGIDTDQSPNSMTFNVTSVNDAPAGTDTTIGSVGPHTFAASEFGFTDPLDAGSAAGANAFQDVIITTIPVGGTGTLTLDTGGGPVAVTAGQSIAVGNIGGLVFTPVGNNTGTFTFQVQDNGGTANSGVDTDQSPNNFTIQQNAPPVIDSDGAGATAAKSIAENTTAVTTVHATDPDNGPSPLSYSIVGGDDQAKFAIGPSTGVLTFITAPDFENPTDTSTAGNNTYIVTVQAFDGSSVDQQTITVTVTDVNDAPVITSNGGLATASINVNENTTAVTTVTSTDQDVPAQTLAYSLAGGADQGKFSIVSSTGVLTFNTAPNFEVPTDTGGDNGYDVIVRVTDNGAPNLHDDQAITVHVQDVNEAPDTGASTVTGNEDAASIAITITGTDVDAGDHVASFHITNIPNTGTQGTLYSDAGLTTQVTEGANVTASGNAATVYFVPNANFNTHAGAVTFNAAGTDTHGLTDATPATETINVTAVDDAPVNNDVPSSFTVQSGFNHVISGLSISDIDANEVGTPTNITTTFTAGAGTVVIGNGGSGTAGIAGGATITTNGTGTVVLTGSIAEINASLSGNNVAYDAADSAANTSSTTTLQIATNDHGNTGTGGPLTDTDTINIGVIPQVWFINGDQTGADATATRGSQTNPFSTVAEFNASSGPGTNDYIYVKAGTYSGDGINLKAGQTLLGDDQALSFANPLGGPAIVIEDGTHARPTINVTTASDQGIALASGNTVAGIVVTTNASTQTGIDDSGASVGTLNISDTDVTGGGQAINLTHGGTGGSVALGTVSSTGGTTGIALGGALVTNFSATSGTLSGHSGSEFSSNGGSGTVSYGGAIGDGTGTTSVSIVNRTGGTVTLSGNITDGNDVNGGIGISGNANTTINFTGAAKTLDTGIGDGVSITSNTGSTVNFTGGGLTVHTTNGTAFSDTVSGTVSVTGLGNTLSTTGTGTALNLANVTVGAGGVTFDSASTTGATNGIVIDTVTGGAINVNGGSIAGATSNGVDIIAAQDNISIAASVASTSAGHSVEVTNSGKLGGNTIAFSGAITDPGLGVNLDNNDQNTTGATINFSGGLNIDSTTHTGFNATNGGTVNVTNGANNSINTTTGTALNIANTTIGGSNVTFHDISANGAVNGIVLNTTGASGHLAVTGAGSAVTDGSNSSGGTIQNTTGDGVSLTNTTGVSFTNMLIQNTVGSGISGTSVHGFTFDNGKINNSGTGHAVQTSNIAFNTQSAGTEDNVDGAINISGNVLTNAYYHGISIFNFAGTISDANISNNTITSGTTTGTGGTSQGSGIQFVGFGSATTVSSVTKAEITGNHINNFPGGDPVALEFGNSNASGPSGSYGTPGNATNVISLTGNTIAGGGTPLPNNTILAVLDGKGQGHFDISSNTLSGSAGNTIDISSQGSANLSVNVANNTIDDTGQDVSGTGGIAAGAGEFQVSDGSFLTNPTLTVAITGNTITHNFGGGIVINDADGSPTVNATISNNHVSAPSTTGFEEGIQVRQLPAATNSTLNLDITGNTTAGSTQVGLGTAPGIGLREDTTGGNVFNIKGLTPDPANGPQTITFVNGKNPASAPDSFGDGGTDIINGGTSTFHAIASVPQPLFAAAGGVQASSPTPGEMNLTQAELDSVVAAAIADWAHAGASAAQLATLSAITFSVADLAGDTIGDQTPGHITIDTDAAGHGWFVDPTPSDNSEFTHAQNAAGTDLLTDPTSAAAGHLDLLTTVAHEMGHELGLPDANAPPDDLMYINLVDGERRLPDATDVAQANADTAQAVEAALPAAAQPSGGAPIVVGTAGNDTIDAGLGGKILFGGGGADNFVFGPDIHLGSATAPSAQPITHVADYSAAQGDTFDFSALTSAFHASMVGDASLVRAVEDPSGTFATLQVNTADQPAAYGRAMPQAPAANWVNVAQLDGAHSGDAVNVLLDSHLAVHLAQIHVGLLV